MALLAATVLLFCFFIQVQCNAVHVVWSDTLDSSNADWQFHGSVNDSVHSTTNCPSSNHCWQIGPNSFSSSATTTISTSNFANFTLQFGITILDQLKLESPAISPSHTSTDNVCAVYYKLCSEQSEYDDSAWILLASYSFDITNYFNNKLPLQTYPLSSSSPDDQNYKSVEIRFANIANDSQSQISCFIDEVSLVADYSGDIQIASHSTFNAHAQYILVGSLLILLSVFVCALWLFCRIRSHAKNMRVHVETVQDLHVKKGFVPLHTPSNTNMSSAMTKMTTPMSAGSVTPSIRFSTTGSAVPSHMHRPPLQEMQQDVLLATKQQGHPTGSVIARYASVSKDDDPLTLSPNASNSSDSHNLDEQAARARSNTGTIKIQIDALDDKERVVAKLEIDASAASLTQKHLNEVLDEILDEQTVMKSTLSDHHELQHILAPPSNSISHLHPSSLSTQTHVQQPKANPQLRHPPKIAIPSLPFVAEQGTLTRGRRRTDSGVSAKTHTLTTTYRHRQGLQGGSATPSMLAANEVDSAECTPIPITPHQLECMEASFDSNEEEEEKQMTSPRGTQLFAEPPVMMMMQHRDVVDSLQQEHSQSFVSSILPHHRQLSKQPVDCVDKERDEQDSLSFADTQESMWSALKPHQQRGAKVVPPTFLRTHSGISSMTSRTRTPATLLTKEYSDGCDDCKHEDDDMMGLVDIHAKDEQDGDHNDRNCEQEQQIIDAMAEDVMNSDHYSANARFLAQDEEETSLDIGSFASSVRYNQMMRCTVRGSQIPQSHESSFEAAPSGY
mmetsp:Transcript_69333/g.110133  ORF Transcript_69333/g.110133 Transcript_69333/m.110133 type:complete len:787 (+) Transcript_69333:58-2418(+)